MLRKKKYARFFLTGMWLFIQVYLLMANGIKTDAEAGRIIREANNLFTENHFSNPIYFSYFTEIALVYIKLKLNTGYGFIIAIHLLANITALLIFYNFLYKLYSASVTAFIAAAILVLCFPYQNYNTYLYTESLFFSTSIIFSCYLLSVKEFTGREIIIISFFLLLLCCTRPTGIIFLPATVVYVFFAMANRYSLAWRLTISTTTFVLFLLLLNYAMGTGGGIDIVRPLREQHVICDIPTATHIGDVKTNPADNSIVGLFTYIFNDWQEFMRLAWLKTKAFFGLRRSYYSTGHNLFVSLYFYPLYFLSIAAIIKFIKNIPLNFIYFATLIISFWLIVIFSCDEWHSRFFFTLTPFIITMAFSFFNQIKMDQP